MNGGIHVALPVFGGPLRHGLDVAACTEGTTSPGKHDAADGVIDLELAEHPAHRRHHRLGHGIPPVRAG